MDRYIGLDVHAASCTAAVIDAQGESAQAREFAHGHLSWLARRLRVTKSVRGLIEESCADLDHRHVVGPRRRRSLQGGQRQR
jgi:hypothetical protein